MHELKLKAKVSGATADESRAAFLAGIAEAERVAATSQPSTRRRERRR